MNRETESKIHDFCIQQRHHFVSSEWLQQTYLPREELASVVLFLAYSFWYGHDQELLLLAEELYPGCVGHLSDLVKISHFDASRFSHMLRWKIDHEKIVS